MKFLAQFVFLLLFLLWSGSGFCLDLEIGLSSRFDHANGSSEFKIDDLAKDLSLTGWEGLSRNIDLTYGLQGFLSQDYDEAGIDLETGFSSRPFRIGSSIRFSSHKFPVLPDYLNRSFGFNLSREIKDGTISLDYALDLNDYLKFNLLSQDYSLQSCEFVVTHCHGERISNNLLLSSRVERNKVSSSLDFSDLGLEYNYRNELLRYLNFEWKTGLLQREAHPGCGSGYHEILSGFDFEYLRETYSLAVSEQMTGCRKLVSQAYDSSYILESTQWMVAHDFSSRLNLSLNLNFDNEIHKDFDFETCYNSEWKLNLGLLINEFTGSVFSGCRLRDFLAMDDLGANPDGRITENGFRVAYKLTTGPEISLDCLHELERTNDGTRRSENSGNLTLNVKF